MGNKTSGVPDALKTIGWIYLVLGIIGAIVIWATMSTMEVKYGSGYLSGTKTAPNPIGIAFGIITLFQSVVVCVLFQAIGLIADMQIKIRNTLVTISDNLLADIRDNTADIPNVLANIQANDSQVPVINNVTPPIKKTQTPQKPQVYSVENPSSLNIECPNCKQEVYRDAEKCRYCGEKFIAETKPQSSKVTNTQNSPHTQTKSVEIEGVNYDPNKLRLGILEERE